MNKREEERGIIMLELLFHPVFVLFTILLFIGLVLLLLFKRKSLSAVQKLIVGIVIGICLLYFAFLLWCIVGFGNAYPSEDPVPVPSV